MSLCENRCIRPGTALAMARPASEGGPCEQA